jgi:tRNA (guanine-N7-)-methyltransferase
LNEKTSDSPAHAQRAVRSFVLRMGRMTHGQTRALAELWPVYGCEFQAAPFDFDTAFGRTAPRILEIGFGAGEALAAYATEHPDVDCLGIEVHRPGVGHLLRDLHTREIRNVRVICHDAVEVLHQQIPTGSLAAVHIFFPDPWPKKRHHKRRLIQPSFIELVWRALEPGGVLRLATDWQEYALHMRDVIEANPGFASLGTHDGYVERPGDRPITRFERRGHRLGHGVWDLAYRKRD